MKNKVFKRLLLLLALSLLTPQILWAQSSREYIRNAIRQYGNCRNVAITKYNGDLMLYGTNGWAAKGCPISLTNALHELNNDNQYIDDVQLTENGRWLILYGNNGFRWNDIPYSLERKLREYNDEGEIVYSVTFNDNGDWIVITRNYFSSSSNAINQWLKDGNDEFGHLWAACITADAIVAVYANGYKTLGEIPQTLGKALRETTLDVFRLKIAGSAWFFADNQGRYSYNM